MTLSRSDNTMPLSLRHCHHALTNRLQRRPPAALQGFCMEVTVQHLFTIIPSKACTEHVHNFLKRVPSILCHSMGTYASKEGTGGLLHDHIFQVNHTFDTSFEGLLWTKRKGNREIVCNVSGRGWVHMALVTKGATRCGPGTNTKHS